MTAPEECGPAVQGGAAGNASCEAPAPRNPTPAALQAQFLVWAHAVPPHLAEPIAALAFGTVLS